MKLKDMRIDPVAIEDGARVESSLFPGVWVKVRGYRSTAYQDLCDQKLEAARASLGPTAKLDKKLVEGIAGDAAIEACLLEWGGIEEDDEAATPLACSTETAKKIFGDPAYAPLKEFFEYACAEVGRAGRAVQEQTLGN